MYHVNNRQFSNLVKVKEKYYMVETSQNDAWDNSAWLISIYECDEYGNDLSFWVRNHVHRKQIHAEFDVVENEHKYTVENAEEIILKALVEIEKEKEKEPELSYVIKDIFNGTITYSNATSYSPYRIRFD